MSSINNFVLFSRDVMCVRCVGQGGNFGIRIGCFLAEGAGQAYAWGIDTNACGGRATVVAKASVRIEAGSELALLQILPSSPRVFFKARSIVSYRDNTYNPIKFILENCVGII